jgi:hypothetical protein
MCTGSSARGPWREVLSIFIAPQAFADYCIEHDIMPNFPLQIKLPSTNLISLCARRRTKAERLLHLKNPGSGPSAIIHFYIDEREKIFSVS